MKYEGFEYVTGRQDMYHMIKDGEEFSVRVFNELQAEIVADILSKHFGLEQANTNSKFMSWTKYVHFFKLQGFWCSAVEHDGAFFRFHDFVEMFLCTQKSPTSDEAMTIHNKHCREYEKSSLQQEVKYKHFRKYNKVIKMSGVDRQVSNLGGFTLAFHECPNDEMAVAMAFCCDEDNFNREVGRQVSRKRLFSRPFLMMNYELEELLRMSYDEVLAHPEFSHMYTIAMGRS